MFEIFQKLLWSHGIDSAAPVKLTDCTLLRPYKLQRAGFDSDAPLYAVILAVPYLAAHKARNISAYAVSRDYHLYFKMLFESVIPILEDRFPGYRFCGFADDSPIDEREAAARAGLGILGDNGLLITEKYSSYVFLGEIITDLPISETAASEIKHCEGCGACKRACPMQKCGQCLSALTQKKGELTEQEKSILLQYGTAWGCDRCQENCPHTKAAMAKGSIYTQIPFFKEALLPLLSSELIETMQAPEFQKRAYAWRKKETILRNLNILEADKPLSNKENI